MSRSPVVARRLLGTELRGLREAAGKRIEDAAARLECSNAKVSRLETGKGKPKVRDVRDLLDLYESVDEALNGRLLTLAADAQEQDWLSDFRDVTSGDMFADHLTRYVELERDSSVLKQYEVDLIPGLLQTPEYIDDVCAAVFPQNSERERKRFVEFRVARKQLLRREPTPPEVGVILNEAALIRQVGSSEVKRHQLETLRDQLDGDLAYVDFRILPITAVAPAALGGPFSIIKFPDSDQDVVYLEGREGATYLENDAAVTRYEQKFSELERAALSRDESLKRLTREIENPTRPWHRDS